MSFDQKMLSGIGLVIFFHSPENKKDLINLVFFHFLTDYGRNLFEIPLIIISDASK